MLRDIRDFFLDTAPVWIVLAVMGILILAMVSSQRSDVARCKAAGGQLFQGLEISGQACIAIPFQRIERW